MRPFTILFDGRCLAFYEPGRRVAGEKEEASSRGKLLAFRDKPGGQVRGCASGPGDTARLG